MTTLHWFRRDLRLYDNPSWAHAMETSKQVIPVYIHCPEDEGKWRRGAASNWWLHHALTDLAEQLRALDCPLVMIDAKQSALEALERLIHDYDIEQVCWNRCYEPAAIRRDTSIKSKLKSAGLKVSTFNGNLLFDPLEVTNKSGTPFKVFTPFWKHLSAQPIPSIAETKATPAPHAIQGIPIKSLNLLPRVPWDQGIQECWDPTSLVGKQLLDLAVGKSDIYQDQRDLPAVDGTSRLSPYLHFGQIGPREFYHSVLRQAKDKQAAELGILRQLFWREFSAHLLYHFPHSQDNALKVEYQHFPSPLDPDLIARWQKGLTGYPIVDAGMRQLWQTGWMHNRVRMIAASFLVKHLLQPWQEGAWWFWDTLVDADLANNTMGWQWIAGCGADATPYFRIFNPIAQGKKFGPKGDYIRLWLPELKAVSNECIHTPWEMEPLELIAAGISLGEDYPHPIVSHHAGRQRALEAYQTFKETPKE